MISTLATNIAISLTQEWDPDRPITEFQFNVDINLSDEMINLLYKQVLQELLAIGWDNKSSYATVQFLCNALDYGISISNSVYMTYMYSGHMFA